MWARGPRAALGASYDMALRLPPRLQLGWCFTAQIRFWPQFFKVATTTSMYDTAIGVEKYIDCTYVAKEGYNKEYGKLQLNEVKMQRMCYEKLNDSLLCHALHVSG